MLRCPAAISTGIFCPMSTGFLKKKKNKVGLFGRGTVGACQKSYRAHCTGVVAQGAARVLIIILPLSFFLWRAGDEAAQQQNKLNFAFDKWVKGPPAI